MGISDHILPEESDAMAASMENISYYRSPLRKGWPVHISKTYLGGAQAGPEAGQGTLIVADA